MARSSQSVPTSRIVLMRQTQIILALLVAGDLVNCGSNPMDNLLQLHRVMQLEPQIKKAIKTTNKTESRKQVIEASEMSQNYALPPREEQQYYVQPQYRQNEVQIVPKIVYKIVQDTQYQPNNPYYTQEQQNNPYNTQEQPNNPYHTQEQPNNPYTQEQNNQYYTEQQNNLYQTQEQPNNQYYTQQQSYIPIAFAYQQPYMEEKEQDKEMPEPQREALQQKYVQKMLYDLKDNKPQTHTTLRYLPLQHLINNLVEPMPPSVMATMTYEKQPVKPVYHYVPVPKGTFPNTKFRSDYKDERIKETRTTEAPVVKEVQNVKDDDGSYPDDQSTYDFGYRVTDGEKGVEMGKMEFKINGVTKGSYHVLLPDGRLQIVNYWSDHTGYHTDITYKSKA